MKRGLVAVALTLSLALAGCLGNSVTISKSGGGIVNDIKSLDCAGKGTLSWTLNGGSDLTVHVHDAEGDEIFEKRGWGGGSDSGSQQLTGFAGNWKLTVAGSYGGQFSVSLNC